METVLNQAQLLAECDKAVSAFETSKRGLHKVFVETGKHIAEHGNWKVAVTIGEKILASETNLSHEWEAGRKWFVKYIGLEWDQDEKKFTGFKGAAFIRDNMAMAIANPYWKNITIAKPFAFNLDEELRKVMTKANKAMKKAKEADSNVTINYEHLEELKIMLGMVSPRPQQEAA